LMQSRPTTCPSSITGKAGRREVRAVLPEGMPYKLDRRHLDKADEVEVAGGKPA
jgi:hypothetical protein